MTAKLTITDENNYPTALVDFERDPNLTLTAAASWANPATDIMGDIEATADKVNSSSRGAIVNELVMRTANYRQMLKNTAFRELLDTQKNLSPGTSNFETGPDSSQRGPQLRGKLSGQYDIWTYDGYYEDDLGSGRYFLPVDQVAFIANQGDNAGLEGRRYHGAIFDMDANMAPVEIFTKTKEEWDPSGVEVLSQSSPMLGMRRPNATATFKTTP